MTDQEFNSLISELHGSIAAIEGIIHVIIMHITHSSPEARMKIAKEINLLSSSTPGAQPSFETIKGLISGYDTTRSNVVHNIQNPRQRQPDP